LYLRQLPPPDLPSKTLVYVYQTTLALVHFSALGLLLIVIVLSIIFSAKFGALIIRKR
jgi:hypothetical protein